MTGLGTRAINRAQQTIRGVMDRIGGAAAPVPEPRTLSTAQQLDRFFGMSDANLSVLRKAKGEEEFRRYTEAMLRLARRKQ